MRTSKQVQELIEERSQSRDRLEGEISLLRFELTKTLEWEAMRRLIQDWEAERVLDHRMERGVAVVQATWWEPTPGGRIRKCYVGAGLRHDRARVELLSVFEVTDYRGRSMRLVHGLCPPLEICLDILRIYKVEKET